MKLSLPLDYAPMEAKSVEDIPTGKQWQYEPKWDGFRCLAFRDGAEIELRSKSGKMSRTVQPGGYSKLRSSTLKCCWNR